MLRSISLLNSDYKNQFPPTFVSFVIHNLDRVPAVLPERARRDVAHQHPDDVVQAAAQPGRVHSWEKRTGQFNNGPPSAVDD